MNYMSEVENYIQNSTKIKIPKLTKSIIGGRISIYVVNKIKLIDPIRYFINDDVGDIIHVDF